MRLLPLFTTLNLAADNTKRPKHLREIADALSAPHS